MKHIQTFLYLLKKISKGLFVLFSINLLILSFIFIFDSCKKSNYENSSNGMAKSRFLNALEFSKSSIGSTTLFKKTEFRTLAFSSNQQSVSQPPDYETIYLQFPTETDNQTKNLIYSTNSIQELSNLIDYSNAIVQYEPTSTNYDYQLQVSIENVANSLKPLINEAKQYLYNKGFSDQDISDMLVEENGREEDLIPFVMSLTQAENSSQVTYNFNPFFINSVYAKIDANDYIRCAVIAIGADVLWSLSTSNASAWTVSAIKKSFGVVAKKMLGPVGVAIVVVSFGLCIAEAYYD